MGIYFQEQVQADSLLLLNQNIQIFHLARLLAKVSRLCSPGYRGPLDQLSVKSPWFHVANYYGACVSN